VQPLCGSRKYPPPQRELEVAGGGRGGGSKVQENPEERGRGERINYFPEGQLQFVPM